MTKAIFIFVTIQVMVQLVYTMITPQSSDWLIGVKMTSCLTFCMLARAQYRMLFNRENAIK